MKRIFIIFTAIFLFSLNVGKANAFYIVDTGAGTDGPPAWSADEEYWYAAEIDLSASTQLTSIFHWQYIYGIGAPNRPIDLAIYADGGDVPNTSNELFRTSYSISETSVTDWYGVSNLNWILSPGQYWIAIEPFVNVDPQDTLFRFVGLPFGSPIPLENTASAYQGSYQNWSVIHAKPHEYGLRITGESVVPEPATMLLFASGLAGAFIRKRFTV